MTKSQDSVQTIRYIRKAVEIDDGWDWMPSNLEAVTVLFTINYDTRTVDAQWATCKKDNFNKVVGQSIAANAPKLTFPYSLVDSEAGLLNALFKTVGFNGDDESYWDRVKGAVQSETDYDKVVKTLLKVQRTLK